MYLKLAKSEVGICGLSEKLWTTICHRMFEPAKKRIILEKALEIAMSFLKTNLPVSNKGEF